jgi:DNA topoisomerase-1
MSFQLMVVESPSKAKTIQQYLGKGYEVLASYGHIRDLIPKQGAVKVDDTNVEMIYQLIAKNKIHLDKIYEKAKKASSILLATDPDREGEAIAFHILEVLKSQMDLSEKVVKRVVFYEITKTSVQTALLKARDLDMNLVNAQQARRALDYLVGFSLSPVLWRKIKPGLSAGRVQSPALRMIADREKEINSFISQEYWTVHGIIKHKRSFIEARLTQLSAKKIEQFSLTTEDHANKAKQLILSESQSIVTITDLQIKNRKRCPAPPFTTSTLQQEASRKINLSAAQTMRIAQQLYEGVAFDGEQKALITYMRTDSVTMGQEAIKEARDCIRSMYGAEYLPAQARKYKTKTKNAQEAHEAIRPTEFLLEPQSIKKNLTPDQYKLYKLIWDRALTSQMSDALYEDQILTMAAQKEHFFESRRSHLLFPGFLSVYQEGIDDSSKTTDDVLLGEPFGVKKGESLSLKDIDLKQHFTESPPRFTEASLVKTMESYGIGRPSTYASIISTLKTRQYVEIKQKRFYPTDMGVIVNDFLTKFFVTYVDYAFTAKMENLLDIIATGDNAWTGVVHDFWLPFSKIVKHVTTNISKKEVTQEQIDEACPSCGNHLIKKFGKTGRFIGCSHYPDCTYTRAMDDEKKVEMPVLERECPLCTKPLAYKKGRFGIFIGCTGYPDCRFIESLNKPKPTGVTCPNCNNGLIVEKKSKKGSVFYSCSCYPACKLALSGYPVKKSCPQCNHPILIEKVTKKTGKSLICPNKDCDFAEVIKDDQEL